MTPFRSVLTALRIDRTRHDLRDGLIVFASAAAVYVVGEVLQIFPMLGQFVEAHAPWSDRLTALVLVFGAAAIVTLYRRRRALEAEIESRRRTAAEHALRVARLDGVLDNMAHGLCVFDADARFVLCNERYRQMYRDPEEALQPGIHFTDLVRHHLKSGLASDDYERYVAKALSEMQSGRSEDKIAEFHDGRIIAISNRPLPGGGRVSIHEDITEWQRARRELAETRNFLDSIIERVPAAIVVKSLPDYRYVFMNRHAETHFGATRDQIIGRTAADIFPAPAAKLIQSEDEDVVRRGCETISTEHPIRTPANGDRIVVTKRLPIFGKDAQPRHLLTVIEDVTERKRAEARIAHMAHHDPLTDLPNRAAFNECLAGLIERSSADGERFAVLCLDLDRFKEVNDVFGHSVGDKLLCAVARRLHAACGGAFLARLGGDEFTLICADGPQPKAAEALAERLLEALNEDIEIDGHPLRSALTLGVAVYPVDGTDAATLFANADAALYRAKTEARGSVRFFAPDMDKALREKRALQQDLRMAIARRQLVLFYQPQALIGGEVTGFEALVRWFHPTRGLVPPGEFIPLAEESGLIISIGECIMREACREAASWPTPLRIAINLSPAQFQHGDLTTLIHSVLLETGLAAERLELEITEGVLIHDFTRAIAILRRLKNLGVRIAMDDFGTGYSSLSYLQSFPFDKMKIDRDFIAKVGRNGQSAAIIRAVIGLGRGLNLPVVAEGVETADQLAFLKREACDEIQGYLIGRPAPIENYPELVGRPAPPKSAQRSA